MPATGYYYIDGIDLWMQFGMIIEKGSAEFLRLPDRKESITHDWRDSNGLDVDTAQPFVKEREGTLQMAIIADSEADFLAKRDAFFQLMLAPGTRRLTIKAHNDRSYYIIYMKTGTFTQVKPLRGVDEATWGPNKVMSKFSIQVMEPQPSGNTALTFIITTEDTPRFIVT